MDSIHEDAVAVKRETVDEDSMNGLCETEIQKNVVSLGRLVV